MQLIRGLENLTQPLSGSALTLGNFDGIHLGHQALIAKTQCLAERDRVQSLVVTFEPQPKEFFAGRQVVPRLMRLREKYIALQRMNVDILLCLRFDKALAALSAEEFVRDILVAQLGMRAIVVGHDFRFGAKRQGDYQLLQSMASQYHFTTHVSEAVKKEQWVVSSTRVREALTQGKMEQVTQLLGRPYSLLGNVVYGHQRGRDLGFPTANIHLHREMVPLSGVFVVRAKLGNECFNGVANVGIRPTFNGSRVVLEAHLFDFNCTIYGSHLEVMFLHQLRPEKRFSDFSDLVAAIKDDVQQAKQYLRASNSR